MFIVFYHHSKCLIEQLNSAKGFLYTRNGFNCHKKRVKNSASATETERPPINREIVDPLFGQQESMFFFTVFVIIDEACSLQYRMNQTTLVNQRFEALFNELKAPVFSYIQSIIRNHQDSEEILQETFLALYQQIQKIQDIDSPKAWTYRVASNFCFTRLRRQFKLGNILKVLSPKGFDESTPGKGSEEQVIRNQEMEILNSLIISLHPKHRAILMLYRDGFSYQEIAEMTHTKIGSVGVTIMRAVKRFEKRVRCFEGG